MKIDRILIRLKLFLKFQIFRSDISGTWSLSEAREILTHFNSVLQNESESVIEKRVIRALDLLGGSVRKAFPPPIVLEIINTIVDILDGDKLKLQVRRLIYLPSRARCAENCGSALTYR